jgi:hypothetical protein
MRQVTVDELPKLIREGLPPGEKIAVVDCGKVVGYFNSALVRINPDLMKPVTKDPKEVDAAFDRLDTAIERALAGSTMTRDELADALDLSKPFPYSD